MFQPGIRPGGRGHTTNLVIAFYAGRTRIAAARRDSMPVHRTFFDPKVFTVGDAIDPAVVHPDDAVGIGEHFVIVRGGTTSFRA